MRHHLLSSRGSITDLLPAVNSTSVAGSESEHVSVDLSRVKPDPSTNLEGTDRKGAATQAVPDGLGSDTQILP